MITAFAGFFASIILLLLISRWVKTPSLPGAVDGRVQHIHDDDVPRLGGVAIFVVTLILMSIQRYGGSHLGIEQELTILICALPVVIVGVVEDITHFVPPYWRYGASFVAALIFVVGAGMAIPRFDVAAMDLFLELPWVAVIASAFCIAGVVQSFNIVDGKNGLSSGMAIVSLSSFLAIAITIGDYAYSQACLFFIAPIAGFWLINIIRGDVFLGDAGAYFLGYLVAALSVILIVRNPQLSPWVVVMVTVYPIVETLFTLTRRIVIERKRFSDPDYLHMHSLLYCRLLRGEQSSSARGRRVANSMVSILLIFISCVVAFISILNGESSSILQLLFLCYVGLYLLTYRLLRLMPATRDAG